MKNIKNRIDWSVKSLTKHTPARNWKGHNQLLPGSMAEELKSALVKKLSAEYANVAPRLVYQAVNEADALASLTTVPLLVLPTLAEEKVQEVAAWTAHQRSLLHSDSITLAA
jgi:hypothetical protein